MTPPTPPTRPSYDQAFWEQLWSKTLREHPDKVAQKAPSATLLAEVTDLRPGRALDAGCGHGVESLWLAANGWHVTAVDFSAAALAFGRHAAEALGPEIAERVDWQEGDLATWPVPPEGYDLVVCLYVHIAGDADSGAVEAMVQRMASGVAPGGSLLMVGHRPVDPETGAATPAAGQQQVSIEAATRALDAHAWELVIAEERPRSVHGSGVDAIIRARRR